MKKSSTRSQITINTTEKRLLSITKKKLIKDKNHRHDKKNHLHGKKFNNLFDEGLMDQFHGIPCY